MELNEVVTIHPSFRVLHANMGRLIITVLYGNLGFDYTEGELEKKV